MQNNHGWEVDYFAKYGDVEESKEGKESASPKVPQDVQTLEGRVEQQEHKISYLQTLLLLKEKKAQRYKEETRKKEQEILGLNQNHCKQISNLVSKLQASEDALLQQQIRNQSLRTQLNDTEQKLKLFSQNEKKIEEQQTQIDHLKKFLSNAKSQIRQLTHQKETADLSIIDLTRKLEQKDARYGLLPEKAAAKVIDRLKRDTSENRELKERLLVKDLHIAEIQAVKDQLENELSKSAVEKKNWKHEKTLFLEAMNERIEKEKQPMEDLLAKFVSQSSELRACKASLHRHEEEIGRLKQLNGETEEQRNLLQKEFEDVEEHNLILEERLQRVNAELEQHHQSYRILENRNKIITEQLGTARRDVEFKDSCIRSLQEQLRELKNQTREPMPSPSSNKYKQRVDSISNSLKTSREALAAHQQHCSFLESEIVRLNREKSLLADMKNETIYRLREEINYKNMLINRDSPEISRRKDSTNSEKPDRIVELENEVEDLRSQNEILRRCELSYFRFLALYVKLQLSEKDSNLPAVSVDDLYLKLPPNLPVDQWNYWMQSQFTKNESRHKRSQSQSHRLKK